MISLEIAPPTGDIWEKPPTNSENGFPKVWAEDLQGEVASETSCWTFVLTVNLGGEEISDGLANSDVQRVSLSSSSSEDVAEEEEDEDDDRTDAEGLTSLSRSSSSYAGGRKVERELVAVKAGILSEFRLLRVKNRDDPEPHE